MNKYIKLIGGYSIGPIIGALISFITIPLITFFISPEEYGKVNMFTLATTLIELIIYLGLDQAFVKYYYEYDKRKIFYNALLPAFMLSILIGFIIVICNKAISFWLFDDESETLLVIMLALYLPFSVLSRFHASFARIAEHAVRYSLFSVLSKWIFLICCIIFFYLTGKQFRSVLYATTLSQVLSSLIMIVINRNEIPIKGAILNKNIINKLLRYGMPLIPATVIGWVLNSMDKVMLRSLWGYEQVGLYSAALKIVSVLAIIQSCFVSFWTPIAFRWHKENVAVSRFDFVGQILGLVMSLLFAMILLFKNSIIGILSPEYSEAVKIVPFLLLHPIMYTISEVTVVGIYFTGKSEKTIFVALVSCVVNIVGNVVLIPKWGAMGASVATGLSYSVFFWIRTYISRRVWKKMKLKLYAIYTVFFVALCSMNIAFDGSIVNIINLISCIAIVIFNLPLIKRLIGKEGILQ